MSTLNIAILQADLHWHDAPANRELFAANILELESDTDLIVLPEMFTTGFSMDAPGQAETMDGPTVNWMREIAAHRNSAIAGSLIVRDNNEYFNRFLLVQPDGTLQHYDKRHLFRLAGEDAHYCAGEQNTTIEVNGWRIRPQICYDLRFPVWSRRQAGDDFDLLLYVANWPGARHHAWATLLRARAIENQCFVVGVNRCGVDGNDLPYLGGSAIVDYLGQDIVNLGDHPGTGTAVMQRADMQKFRMRFPFAMDADVFEFKR